MNNNIKQLISCIKSIKSQETKPNKIFIIVNNYKDYKIVLNYLANYIKAENLLIYNKKKNIAIFIEQNFSKTIKLYKKFIWLIYSNCIVRKDVLKQLSNYIYNAPSVNIVGCQAIDKNSVIIDSGFYISKQFQKVNFIHKDEIDQGQHNFKSDVFGLYICSLLIKLETWKKLKGFNFYLNYGYEDIEFYIKNRIYLKNSRVVIVPNAKIICKKLNSKHIFKIYKEYINYSLYLRIKYSSSMKAIFIILIENIKTIYFLVNLLFILKKPIFMLCFIKQRYSYLIRGIWAHCKLFILKFSDKFFKKANLKTLNHLLVSNSSVKNYKKIIAEDLTNRKKKSKKKFIFKSKITFFIFILMIFSMYRMFYFLDAVYLEGGSLLPVSHDIRSIISQLKFKWIYQNEKIEICNPFNWLLLIVNYLTFQNTSKFIVYFFVFSVPLSFISMFFFLRSIIKKKINVCLLFSLLWSNMPVLKVEIAQGRLSSMIVHIILPIFFLCILRFINLNNKLPSKYSIKYLLGREKKINLICMIGLCTFILAVSAPSILFLLFFIFLVISSYNWKEKRIIFISCIPTIFIFIPFLITPFKYFEAFFGDPGIPLFFERPSVFMQILGFPVKEPFYSINKSDISNILLKFQIKNLSLILDLLIGFIILLLAIKVMILKNNKFHLKNILLSIILFSILLSKIESFVFVSRGNGNNLITPFTGPLISFINISLIIIIINAMNFKDYQCFNYFNKEKTCFFLKILPNIRKGVYVVLFLMTTCSLGIWFFDKNHIYDVSSKYHFLIKKYLKKPLSQIIYQEKNNIMNSRILHLDNNFSVNSFYFPDFNIYAYFKNRSGDTLDQTSSVMNVKNKTMHTQCEDNCIYIKNILNILLLNDNNKEKKFNENIKKISLEFISISLNNDQERKIIDYFRNKKNMFFLGKDKNNYLWKIDINNEVNIIKKINIINSDNKEEEFNLIHNNIYINQSNKDRILVFSEKSNRQWKAWVNNNELTEINNVKINNFKNYKEDQYAFNQIFSLPSNLSGYLVIKYEALRFFKIIFFIQFSLIIAYIVLSVKIPNKILKKQYSNLFIALLNNNYNK